MKEKHALVLRIIHWLNVPLLALMVWSGLLIYWAYDPYPGFFPDGFYKAFNIPSRLAEGMAIHFFTAWLFVANGIAYLIWYMISRHYREVWPDKEAIRLAVPTLLHDIGIHKTPPPQRTFNAVQKIAYSALLIIAALAITSGFALYKPVQLWWLTACFGGYQNARLVHFLMMIFFCVFVVVHVLQVARAGWNNFRAMVAGFENENE